jgi:arylsulfatase A-like enzyme/tetratricopeptide (TPR) repeat protein
MTARRAIPLILLLSGCAGGASREPRSVVLVTIDTLRADRLGVYGGEAATPTLDALARQGARFERVFAQSPLTLPSHSSILTGTNPTFHGVRDNGRFRLPAEMETLAEILKGQGYETAAFVGGFPLDSRFGLDQGFDVYEDSIDRSRSRVSFAERPASEVVASARTWIAGRKGTLFFAWVHLFDPHAPYKPPAPFPQGYEGEIAFVDAALKELFVAVPKEALVSVTADHGEGLGEHGETTHSLFVYDSTLRVPWILRGPAVPAETVVDETARSIDVVPTILDLMGMAETCVRCQGRSLVPALYGASLLPAPSYAETYFPRLNLGWSELRSLQQGGWKYIEAPEPELYETSSDPGEIRNLAVTQPERLGEMRSELAKLDEATAGAGTSEELLDGETRAILRSLGYLSSESPGVPEGPRPDPKSRLQVWEGIRSGMDRVARGELDQAIVELEAVTGAEPELVLARTYLALAYFERGRHHDAMEECGAVLARAPSDFDATLLLGKSLLRLGRTTEARLVLERATSIDDASPEPWVELAQIHLHSGASAEAEAALKNATERDDGAPSVLLLQGKVAMMSGSMPYAEKLFRAAIEAAPTEEEPRVQLGNLLLSQRRLEEAEELFRQSLEARPQASALYLGLGHSRALAGKMPEAIGSFEKALELSPDSTLVLNSLGFAYLEAGNFARGMDLLRRSLSLNPTQPELVSLLTPKK